MTKLNEDLIDLGVASIETKGVSSAYPADEIQQHRPTPGLAAD